MKIVILGIPQSQLRPRATRMGKGIRLYDPKKTAEYKQYVRETASLQWNHRPLEGALNVKINVYRPIQKSESKKRKKLKEQGFIRPSIIPDATNYAKIVEDGLNGVVWEDDKQIVDLHISKFYSDNPRVEIEVRCID